MMSPCLFLTAVRCSLLEAPENGQINCTDEEQLYNSQCSFMCDQGYSLDGHQMLTCGPYGNWTEEKPTCKGKYIYIINKKEIYSVKFEIKAFTFHYVSSAPSPVTAIASGVATGGTALLSGLSAATYILKRLRKKASKFELNRLDNLPPLISLFFLRKCLIYSILFFFLQQL